MTLKKCEANCTAVEVLATSQKNLQDNFAQHCEDQNGNTRRMWESLDALKNSFNAFINDQFNQFQLDVTKGRPSWATSIIITVLCSAVVGLAVALILLKG